MTDTTTREFNHDMVALAKSRGTVVVTTRGMSRQATLVAWEPSRRGRRDWGKARVQFVTGTTATVNTTDITVPDDDSTPTETRTCRECQRVFDMMDRHDAEEWAYGHDCEA